MKIEEGNWLIAIFMGLSEDNTDDYVKPAYYVEDYYISPRFKVVTDVQYCTPYELPYRKSWDWLIPVITKCIKNDIFYSEYTNQLHDGLLTQNIKECWLAVVEFIKWYNKQ